MRHESRADVGRSVCVEEGRSFTTPRTTGPDRSGGSRAPCSGRPVVGHVGSRCCALALGVVLASLLLPTSAAAADSVPVTRAVVGYGTVRVNASPRPGDCTSPASNPGGTGADANAGTEFDCSSFNGITYQACSAPDPDGGYLCRVTLRAVVRDPAGWRFDHWTGACAGASSSTCSVTTEVKLCDPDLKPPCGLHLGGAPKAVAHFVDTRAPTTVFTELPPSVVSDGSQQFRFGTDEDREAPTLRCQKDGSSFFACSSGFTWSSIRDGAHTFSVNATDASGLTGAVAHVSFTVNTTEPNTIIDSGPQGATTDQTATFAFHSSVPGATFECAVDSGPFARCTSPHTTAPLAGGAHTFRVRATDAAGNTDPTPATRDFSIETTLPAARLSLSVPHRATQSWKYWRHSRDAYERGDPSNTSNAGYVYSRLHATADACRSSGGSVAAGARFPLTSFVFRFTRLDGPAPAVTEQTRSCRISVGLPELGRWRVEVTATDRSGGSATAVREVRDIVVLALGDSMTSGEGNPDRDVVWGANRFGVVPHPVRAAVWKDRQCDRSAASWAALVARRLENPSTSVTFLDFACSGADTNQVGFATYNGEDPGRHDHALAPQVTAAQRALGPLTDPATRAVDAVLMSTGINDLDFTGALKHCITDRHCTHGERAKRVLAGLHALPSRYAELAALLPFHLRVANPSVHVLEYPIRLFTDSNDHPHHGCSAFRLISTGTAEWFLRRGNELNHVVQNAAGANGWTYLPGVVSRFRTHGYCAAHSWYRSLSASLKLQGNVNGTIHPIRTAHAAMAVTALRNVRLGPAPPPPVRLVVQLQRLRLVVAKTKHKNAYLPSYADFRPSAFDLDLTGLGLVKRVTLRQATGLPTKRTWQTTLPDTAGASTAVTAGDRVDVTGALTLERPAVQISRLLRGQKRSEPGEGQTGTGAPPPGAGGGTDRLKIGFHRSYARADNWGIPPAGPIVLPGSTSVSGGVDFGPAHHVVVRFGGPLHGGPAGTLEVDYRVGIAPLTNTGPVLSPSR